MKIKQKAAPALTHPLPKKKEKEKGGEGGGEREEGDYPNRVHPVI